MVAGCTDLFDGCGAWAGLTTRCVGPVGGHGVGILAARYVSPLGGRVCWPVWRPGVSAHLAVGCVDPFGGQVCRPIWWPGVLAHLVARGVGLLTASLVARGAWARLGAGQDQPVWQWAVLARLAAESVGPFGGRVCQPIWWSCMSAHLVVGSVGQWDVCWPIGGRVCWPVGGRVCWPVWRPSMLTRRLAKVWQPKSGWGASACWQLGVYGLFGGQV